METPSLCKILNHKGDKNAANSQVNELTIEKFRQPGDHVSGAHSQHNSKNVEKNGHSKRQCMTQDTMGFLVCEKVTVSKSCFLFKLQKKWSKKLSKCHTSSKSFTFLEKKSDRFFTTPLPSC